MLLINQAFYAAQPSASTLPIAYSAIYADVPGHTDAKAADAEKLIQQTFPLASIQTTKQALAGNQAQVQQIQYFLQVVGLLALLIGGVGIQAPGPAALPAPMQERTFRIVGDDDSD